MTTPKNRFKTAVAALAVLSAWIPPAWTRGAEAASGPRPNIVLILADDLGYGDIGCYGATVSRTPHLDRLARQGVRFTDFHSNGAMCTPTRAALLTGLYPSRFGRLFEGALSGKSAYDEGLPLDAVTIAEVLGEAGYACGMYGKWHLGYHPPFMPTRQGFHDYRGLVGGGGDHFSHIDRSGREDWWHNEEIEMEDGYSAELITRHGVAFIEQHKDAPFFLYLPHQVIHFPWQGPGDQAYRRKGGDYWNDKHGRIADKSNVSPYVKAMVESLDQSVGRIMATLDRLDLDRRTLVFFASDNGGYLRYAGGYENISSNGPLRGQKGDMYEGGHRVPAIARWPGVIEPGTVAHDTAATFDLFPTLLDVVGRGDKAAELDLDGRSLAPLLFENAAAPERTLFWRMRGAKAVRRGPWKLVIPPGERTPQLYNLREDISESHDLAAERPDVVSSLKTELSAWESDVDRSGAAESAANRAVNSLGMTLARIEPGAFAMGSRDGDWDERPVHRVAITRPFFMATTEVTNRQYEQFDPSHRKYRGIRGVSREDDEAAVYVSWREAVAFCRWLTEKEGKPYRLPTEAEWEYACRAGTATRFHTGDELPMAFRRNQPVEGDWATERTRKDADLRAKKGKAPVSLRVATTPANQFGLHEMHGNVEEWCFDWYGEYPTSPETMDPTGPADGLFKVSRGGSHNTYVRHLRSANRHATLPEDKHWLIGFRVVQAPPLKTKVSSQANNTLNDDTVSPVRAEWSEPADKPFF